MAQSAIELRTKGEKSVVFMDEPGEHKLILKKVALAFPMNSDGIKIGLVGTS
ncbi:hypothetical protein KUH03_02285 [Sphingobacterium sp. E70]|uniref:hypothetical protein n=1 Tax=Sphingobacterium sp. E70 TaxID=2853439 RepID=UPI00211D0F08|nr:hypothetical protein [Sphingobacterium sp. E70]ULT25838.1 hypothetical protein KUH03_02285 [Sphingobacterium sp. E70]